MFHQLRRLFLPHHSNNLRSKILHIPSLAVLLVILAFSQAGISWLQTVRPDILGYASQIPSESIISLTNQERARYSLPPLSYNAQLADAARRKAADMFANDYWAHNSPSGVKPWYWVTAAGYSYLHAGENLARDFTNPEAVVTAWMNSPTHRDNVISSKYHDIGVAVVDGFLGGVETTLVVQMFGTLQSAAPAIDEDAQSIVDTAQAQEPTNAPQVSGEQETQPLPTLTPTPASNLTPYESVSLSQTPLLSTFDVSRSISLAFALLLLVVLAVDWFVAWQQNLIRLSGKNWAHITYLVITIILGFMLNQGLVL